MTIDKKLAGLMQEAEKMQRRMVEAQEELTHTTVEGQAGGGMVKIKMNGRHDVLEVKINPAMMDEDTDMLGDLIAAAVNDAVRKVEKASKDKITQLTAGLNLPADFLKDAGKE